MRKKFLYLLLSWMACMSGAAQVSIDSCYAAAERNYPMVKRYGLIRQSARFTVENAGRGYLPQFRLTADIQVQSDVTSLPFDFSRLGLSGPEAPEMSKDRYNVALGLTQTIYDGGDIRARRQSAQAQAEVEMQEVRVSQYALRQRVNELYFGVLLTDEQLRINAVVQATVAADYRQVESLVRGGVASEADLNVVKVEQLKAEQAAVGYRAVRKAYMQMLAAMTGLPLDEGSRLVKPVAAAGCGIRPEILLYDRQRAEIDIQRCRLDARLRPNVSFFAQGGYGRPGLNMLKNDFAFYGIAGINLTWNISAFYTRKNDLRMLGLKRESVDVAEEVFRYNRRVETAQRSVETERWREVAAKDAGIISLREQIRKTAEAQLTGGTQTATEVMRRVNEEEAARLDHALHEMQYLLATYNLKFIQGE